MKAHWEALIDRGDMVGLRQYCETMSRQLAFAIDDRRKLLQFIESEEVGGLTLSEGYVSPNGQYKVYEASIGD